jgi:hypothetical protein
MISAMRRCFANYFPIATRLLSQVTFDSANAVPRGWLVPLRSEAANVIPLRHLGAPCGRTFLRRRTSLG